MPRIVVIFLSVISLFAQNPFGKIAGRISDSSGRAVVSASVKVTHVETNVTTTVAANEDGNYESLNLIPGQYNIVVMHPGFKQFARKGMELHVGDSLDIPAVLEVGAVSETVTVTGDAPLLETTNADVGQIVDNKRLNELPLPGGQPMYLMQLSPGVVSTNPPTHGWLPQAVDAISNMGAAGTRTRSSEFALDGIPNMSQGGMVSFSPPPEMVQEFRITTSPFDASVGH